MEDMEDLHHSSTHPSQTTTRLRTMAHRPRKAATAINNLPHLKDHTDTLNRLLNNMVDMVVCRRINPNMVDQVCLR